jgi:hypothetical protein
MEHVNQPPSYAPPPYEKQEVNVKLIVVALAGLVIAVIIVLVIVWGIFQLHVATTKDATPFIAGTVSPLATTPPPLPESKVEEHPWEYLPKLREHEDHILSTYGWVDQKAGVVRIPVDRAIDLTLQKGLPVRKEGSPDQAAKPQVARNANATQNPQVSR